MKWEIIIQAIGALLATLISIYQIKTNIPRSRNKLKQDLEILRLLSPDSESYKLIKKSIDKDINTIYALKTRKGSYDLNINKIIDLISGILFFFIGSLWTIYLMSQSEPNLWIIVSIIMVVGGLGQILAGMGNKRIV